MAAGIPTRLTPADPRAQGRKFGLTVGAAFLALAAVAYWRGRHSAAAVLAAIGGALILAALVVPARLGPVERAWMRMALAISKVTTPVFMAAIYFLVLTPVGLLRRSVSRSPMARQRDASSYWVDRTGDGRRGNLLRQF